MARGVKAPRLRFDTSHITPEQSAAELVKRDDAHDHLLDFCTYTNRDWIHGEHQKKICDALERVEQGYLKRLCIFAPPRHGKSEIASRRFPAWYLGRNPKNQIICATYNHSLAYDMGVDVRQIVDDQYYRNIFPEVSLNEDLTAKDRWRTNAGGIYVSRGVGGDITGRGAHVALIDDPLKGRAEADSEIERNKAWNWYNGTLITRLMPGGAIVLILTRWHEDDLAGRVLQYEDWEVLSLPAIQNEDIENPENEKALWNVRYPLDDEYEDGKMVRHGLRPIRERYRRGGRLRDWHSLYQQNPQTETGIFFKREWFEEKCEEPYPTRRWMSLDFAVKEVGEGAEPDWTEFGVFALDSEQRLIVVDWWSGQTTADVWIEILVKMVKRHKPSAVFGEGGVIRRALEPFIRKEFRKRKTFCRLEWINPIKDKPTRARAFQGMASMGWVRFPNTRWADKIIEQCVAFPNGKNDDKVDVCSQMCMAIDQAHGAMVSRPSPKPKQKDLWADDDNEGVRRWRTV